MVRNLRNLSIPFIIKAIEDNFVEFILTYVRAANGECIEESEFTRVCSSILMPYFNGIIRTKLTNTNIHTVIEKTLAYFSTLPQPITWWITSSTLPDNLDIYLKAHNLRFVGRDIGMAIDLSNIQETFSSSAGLTIEVVHEEQALKDWLSVYGIGFGLSQEVRDNYGKYLALMLSSQDPIGPYYLARLNGQPVGTSSLFTSGKVAGIYEVATLPAIRRQGIGAAIVLAALREARALGYKIGVLQASDMGISLYHRLGFHEYSFFDAYSNR